MPVVDVYNIAREKVDSVSLPENIFQVEAKEHLFHLVVRYQLAARRAGTHATKQRAMVAGGGKKPWRQKGTGRARQGSTRSPQWRGGGVVFGPQVRSHSFMLPKKVRRAALRGALTRRVSESAFYVLDSLALPEAKTKHFANFMRTFSFDSLLVVLPEADEAVMRAARNIPGVTVLPVEGLNVYDVLRHRNVAVTLPAINRIVERLER